VAGRGGAPTSGAEAGGVQTPRVGHLNLSLFSTVCVSDDAVSQCRWVNLAVACQVDYACRNDLATFLVACVNLESDLMHCQGGRAASMAARISSALETAPG
jgi:hypothetical protein